jgi:hypothetical protein
MDGVLLKDCLLIFKQAQFSQRQPLIFPSIASVIAIVSLGQSWAANHYQSWAANHYMPCQRQP